MIVRDAPLARSGPRRRDRDARHRRLRLRAGQQLQRRAPSAGGLLPATARPGWSSGARPTRIWWPATSERAASASGCSATAPSAARSRSCLPEHADRIERITGLAPELSGVLTRRQRLVRRAARALGSDRRADRRDRARPASTCCGRCAPDATSSPPTSSCSPSTARSCGRRPAPRACSCASRAPWPASCRSSACSRSRSPARRSTASTGSSTARRTSSSPRWRAPG